MTPLFAAAAVAIGRTNFSPAQAAAAPAIGNAVCAETSGATPPDRSVRSDVSSSRGHRRIKRGIRYRLGRRYGHRCVQGVTGIR